MDRARRAGFTALIVVVVVAAAGGFAGPKVQAASVAWPPSTLACCAIPPCKRRFGAPSQSTRPKSKMSSWAAQCPRRSKA